MAVTTSDAKSWISCAICGEALALEDAKTGDQGEMVHEDCYVKSVVGEAVEEFGE
jgi:hypothetical protein